MDAVVGGDADARAKRMVAADLETIVLYDVELVRQRIDRENVASQGVARRLGAVIEGEFDLFGHAADVWVTHREVWTARPKP